MPCVSAACLRRKRSLTCAEKRGIGDDASIVVFPQPCCASGDTGRKNIKAEDFAACGKAVLDSVAPSHLSRFFVTLEQRGRLRPVEGQGHKPSRAHSGPEIEQARGVLGHRGTQQHAIKPRAKAVPRLRQSDPPGQKGIARCGLVFYKVAWLV